MQSRGQKQEILEILAVIKARSSFVLSSVISAVLAASLLGAMANNSHAGTSTLLVPAGLSLPLNGFVATGSAGFRHLWFPDKRMGLCRVDPDLNAAGPHAINPVTCVLGGPAVYDAQAQRVYVADDIANTTENQGVVKMTFSPGGGSGHGLISSVGQTSLGGTGSCGLGSNQPTAMEQGPDGNLYIVFQENSNIIRIAEPNGAVACSNFQIIGQGALGANNVGLAWVGHTLYGIDGATPWQIIDADKCVTPANGLATCHASTVFADAATVPAGIASDQQYPSTNGTSLFITDSTSITKVAVASSVVTPNWATGMANPTSVSVDRSNPASPTVYVGDDSGDGNDQAQGRMFKLMDAVAPAAPGASAAVPPTAAAAAVNVSGTPVANGILPTAPHTAHTVVVAGQTALPDLSVVVTPPAVSGLTATTVTGLTNGALYALPLDASNAAATPPALQPGIAATPQPAGIPGAPLNVSAFAGNAAASVAWTSPESNGGSPILNYTVTYSHNGSPQTVNAPASATGTVITGLTNGQMYAFTVHASNAVGNSPESSNSNPATPIGAPQLDVGLTMNGPASVLIGNATYTLIATNVGGLTAPQVLVTDILPATGATFVSSSTDKGACLQVGKSLTCNLGSMAPGKSATMTVTLNVTSATSNSASVQLNDKDGTQLTDHNTTNNAASISTGIDAPPAPPPSSANVQSDPKPAPIVAVSVAPHVPIIEGKP